MCRASKYANELEVLLRNIGNDVKVLRSKQSEYDKKLSEHYHKIELAKFNAAEGYYLSKRLQVILQERRLIKSELYRLNALYNTLNVRLVSGKLTTAQSVIRDSKKRSKAWNNKLNIIFEDIGIEFNH